MRIFYNNKLGRTTLVFTLLILFSSTFIFSQTETNVEKLLEFAQQKKIEQKEKRDAARALANLKGLTIRSEDDSGKIIEIMSLKRGIPQYYETNNINAAISTRTDKLWSNPFNLSGSGYNQLGEWDGGGVLLTHQEFGGRVTQMDTPSSNSDHSTHVAGTMIASGIDPNAKGMAYEGNLKAWEWTDDEAEMATAAANGLQISNHSYGFVRGWYPLTNQGAGFGDYWFGDKDVSTIEDFGFGFYDVITRDLDQIAYDAPFYLIVKSAGNDRGQGPFGFGGKYWWDPAVGTEGDWVSIPSGTEPDDDGGTSGFDCIGVKGVAKNILTVGAIDDVNEYTGPGSVTMSSFSGWGPTDDGRIKPDVVGNGVSVYSPVATGNTDYDGTYSGTSMSSPNVSGSMALLQQYYQSTHSSEIMRAATLKALVIHSADEAGANDGPDYQFGWGLVNAERAAQIIEKDISTVNSIDEQVLSNGSTYSRSVVTDGSEPLVATIVWTDIPGTPVAYSLDPSDPMLVHDLDLKITKDGTTYYPWKLDRNNPANAATNNTANHVDNVEMVEILSPSAGTYTVEVSHTGTLSSDQAFSIIISGDTTPLAETLVDIKIMLQGAFDGSSGMNTTINTSIPNDAPYTSAPPKNINPIPSDIVDWVLVELRESPTGPTVVSESCLLRNDGVIVGDDGTSKVGLSIAAGSYHIVVKHRNHLSIMSKDPVVLPNTVIYDFTTGSDKYYGTGGAVQLD